MIKNADGVEYKTPHAVVCDDRCGVVCLTSQEYERQLARPNQGWTCPSCGGRADWDDDCPETNPEEKPLWP